MRVITDQTPGFVDEMVAVPDTELTVLNERVDWPEIERLLEPVEGDYVGLSLFKMLLLQTWHNLSDDGIAKALTRDLVFIRFCGFSLEGHKPDASTLCRFRNRLVRHDLFDSLLRVVNQSLEVNGLKLAHGKYISSDATLIASARRPKRVLQGQKTELDYYEMADVVYSDDREATWIKQGSQSVYGYSASVTTDESGLIEAVSTFAANCSEMTRLEEVLNRVSPSPGQTLLYDKGVDSAANRYHLKARGLKDGIMRKKPKGQAMAYWERIRNKLISQRRFVTERTFGTLKRTYGLYRSGYVGLVKTQAEVMIKAIAYNLRRGLNNALRAIETG